MINLLPFSQRTELKKEEQIKIILNLELLLFIIFFCLGLFFWGIKTYLYIQIDAQKTLISAKEQELNFLNFSETKKELEELDKVFENLKNFYEAQPDIIKILEKIFDSQPKGLYLTNFSYSSSNSGINLSGYAPNRDSDLLPFKNNLELEKGKLFKEVFFPNYNWLKPLDVNFNVNIILK